MTASLDLLTETLAQALETTAFVSLAPPESDSPTIEQALIVTIPLGAMCRLHLAAPRDFGAMVAANILAIEPSSDEAQARAQDALQEILNVVAGLYLSQAPWLEGVIPEMGLPQTRFIPEAAQVAEWIQSVSGRIVSAEGHSIAIAIEGRL